MDAMMHAKKLAATLLSAALAGAWMVQGAQAGSFSNVDVAFKAAGWMKSGMIMHSTDTLTGTGSSNYNGNWMQEAGILFTGIANLNENFEAAFGIGAIQKHPNQGLFNQANAVSFSWNIFSTQSRFTWFPGGNKQNAEHKLDVGAFPYKYDNNIKNLGLYLIRGAVYPGLLVSGFETKEMLGTANMLGAHWQDKFGAYTEDFVLTSETDLRPLFDFSAIYVGTLKLGSALELGAGVNFYHYLPVRPGVTTPSEAAGYDPVNSKDQNDVPNKFDYIYAVPETTFVNGVPQVNYTWVSNKGIKLMGRFAFDPQALLGGSGLLGKQDLKLYGEIGVLGTKNYPGVYDKIAQRIPVMLGFNIPTFKLLDVLALEVEYYASPLIPDYRRLTEFQGAIPESPWIHRNAPTGGPLDYSQKPYDTKADNVKWSLYGAKVMAGHVKLSGQLADDHTRTGGTPGAPGKSYEEALTTLKDWYWMLKLSYFF